MNHFHLTLIIEKDLENEKLIVQTKSLTKMKVAFTSEGAIFSQETDRTIETCRRKPVFEKNDGRKTDEKISVPNIYTNAKHSGNKLITIQYSLKKNEAHEYKNFLKKN